MLDVLLDPNAGEGFFVAYQNPVQAWVLFNNEASCKGLGPALTSSDQSRVAEVVLSGTLQMLEQYKAGNEGRVDPRQRLAHSDLSVREVDTSSILIIKSSFCTQDALHTHQ